MARSLLIAILSLAAVAGPAAGQIGPAWSPVPVEPPTLETVFGSAAVVACNALLCSQAVALYGGGDCRAFRWTESNFQLDPDGCVRDLIDELPPGAVGQTSQAYEPTPETGDASADAPAS